MTREQMTIVLSLFGAWSLVTALGCDSINTVSTSAEGPREYIWRADTLRHSPISSSQMESIWGTSRTNIYVAGWNDFQLQGEPLIYKFDGKSWQPVTMGAGIPGALEELTCIYGFGEDNIYVGGVRRTNQTRHSLLYHYDGIGWDEIDLVGGATLSVIWGRDQNDVWALGYEGTAFHFDGQRWAMMSVDTLLSVTSLVGASAIDLYALGTRRSPLPGGGSDYTLFLRFNGISFTGIDSVQSYFLFPHFGDAMLGYVGKNLYSIGSGIFRYHDGIWIKDLDVTNGTLLSLVSTSGTNAIVVGQNAQAVHYDGSTWVRIQPTQKDGWEFKAVWTDGHVAAIVGNRDGKSVVFWGE